MRRYNLITGGIVLDKELLHTFDTAFFVVTNNLLNSVITKLSYKKSS